MTRILIFLAIAGAGWAAPALAQSATARPPSDAGSAAPAKPEQEDFFQGLVKGIVKAVVEEAQKPKEVPPPPAESAAAPAVPAPVAEAIPAAAPAPQPEPAAGAPPPAAPAEPALPLAPAEPKPVRLPEPGSSPPETLLAPSAQPSAAPAPSPAAAPAGPATPPTPVIAEPPAGRPAWFWLLALLLPVAAVGAVHQARLMRTKRLLSLEPRLESELGAASASAFDFAAPPVSIRCRMEMEVIHA
jgi:hypothetical protein